MKKSIKTPTKIGMLLASCLLVCNIVSATVYTAVASGNWSLSATWGGTAPPFTLSSSDQVIIPLTFTVNMDKNVTLNAAGASLDVLGTLSGLPYIKLNDISGTITGAGSINAANIMLGSGGALTFTGAIIADTITNSLASLTTTAQVTFFNELNLSGLLTLSTAGVLTAGSNSNITISGSGIVLSGGTAALTANYTVNYITSSITAGAELTGTGLGIVTINVPALDTVTLTTNVIMNNSLNFNSGILKLNGFNLTTSSQLTGSVAIAGRVLSSLTVNTATGLSTPIKFVNKFQNLDNLTINVGTGNSIAISSGLTVNGILAIPGNSIFNITGESLTVIGNMTGTGTLLVNSLTKLAFTGIASVTGNLILSGITIGKFTEDIGSANSIKLATDLNVDTLNLVSGTLVLNGKNLSINADIAPLGTGMVLSTTASSINVTTASAVTDSIMFPALGDSLKNLNINIGAGGSLKLGSDLVIAGNLNFIKGYIDAGSSNLLIDTKGTVTGASNTSYIFMSNGGYLTMSDTIGKTTTYPVGSSGNYLPATLDLNIGSTVGTVGVSALPGVYSHGTSGVVISASQPMVNGTWLFQNNIGVGINANMQLSWTSAAEVNGFLHTKYDYISHYASMWDDIGDSMIAIISGSLYTVARTNVTSMSPFAVFDGQTIPTGLNEFVKTDGSIRIYPNPTSENLNIQNNTGLTDVVYGEIYNALGQVVSTFQFKDAVTTVPVNGLANGLYFLRLYNDKMAVVEKFSKI